LEAVSAKSTRLLPAVDGSDAAPVDPTKQVVRTMVSQKFARAGTRMAAPLSILWDLEHDTLRVAKALPDLQAEKPQGQGKALTGLGGFDRIG
jgi:hypothetical protein